MKRLQQFLKKLQKADEATKKIWIAVLSGISMVILVIVWISYLTATLPKQLSLEESSATSTTAEKVVTPEPESHWAIFKRGFASISDKIKNQMSFLKEYISSSTSFVEKQTEILNNTNAPEAGTATTTLDQLLQKNLQETASSSKKLFANEITTSTGTNLNTSSTEQSSPQFPLQ